MTSRLPHSPLSASVYLRRGGVLALPAAGGRHQVVEGGGVAVHVPRFYLLGQGRNVEYLRLPLGA